MKNIATVSILFIAEIVFAQAPLLKQWDRRYGAEKNENLAEFQQTPDGNYILAGTTESDPGGDITQWGWSILKDYLLIKIDRNGNKLWDKRYGGSGDDVMWSMVQTDDKGFLLAGFSNSTNDGERTEPTRGGYDYWIVKTDSQGNKLWDKRFGGSNDDILRVVSKTRDHGFILGGVSFSDNDGDKSQPSWVGSGDYWIVKTDSLGNKQWDKRFGGTANDYMYALRQTKDGGYIMAGNTNSRISGDKTQDCWLQSTDFWVVKTDSLGTKQWDRRYGGMLDERYFNDCLVVLDDGGYIIAGETPSGVGGEKTQPSKGSSDVWFFKIDANGNPLWDKVFGGDGWDEINRISPTSDGGYLLLCSSYTMLASGDKSENNLGVEQNWIIKTDSLWNKQWDKTLHTNSPTRDDESSSGFEDVNGRYVFANYTCSQTGGDKTQPNRDTTNYTYDFWVIGFTDTSHIQAEIVLSHPLCDSSCKGELQVVPMFGTPPYSYHWQLSSDTTPTLQNLCAGVYTVVVTDAAGSTVVKSFTIDNFTIQHAVITASQNSICANDSALICTLPNYTLYNWNNGQTSTCITASLAGNYYVTVTDANGCTAESNHLAITVHPLPPVSISVNGDTLSVYNATSQQWYVNGNAITGATDSVYIARTGGSYTVQITDTNGCVAASTAVIVSGVENVKEEDVVSVWRIADGGWQLTVGNNWLGSTAEVFDANGRVVFKSEIRNPKSEIATALPRGVYLLRISSSKSNVVKKLVRL